MTAHTEVAALAAWAPAFAASEGPGARLARLAFPSRKEEAWRSVRLRELADTAFVPADQAPVAEVSAAQLAPMRFDEAPALLVLVDGRLRADLSVMPDAPVRVEVIEAGPREVPHGSMTEDFFATLNAAACTGGVMISVGADQAVEAAVHVLSIASGRADEAALSWHPRVEVRVGRGSALRVIEDHVTLGDAPYWVNALVHVHLEDNARLDHVKLQRDGLSATHIARASAHLSHGSHYASVTVHTGASLSRQDIFADIVGGNTTCALHGLTLIAGQQVSDTHSAMNHAHPHALSDQLHKCVIGERAHAVFNGKIVVRQQAQQINAFQLNRNLLLSGHAKIDTKPQLEIFADDVKCSHGATIGQLDEDQVFYLASRGIPAQQARALLTFAFAGEVVERVPMASVREALQALVASRVAG